MASITAHPPVGTSPRRIPGRIPLGVMAAPKSGTRWMHKLLREVGLDVGHECMQPDGCVSCFISFDEEPTSPHYGRHWGSRSEIRFEQLWHQVRHPLYAVWSIAENLWTQQNFVEWQQQYTGIEWNGQPKSPMAQRVQDSAGFWLAINEQALLAKPVYTYRLEQVPDVWPEMCERLGVPRVPLPDIDVLQFTSKAHERPPIGWGDLGRWQRSVRFAARYYGYEA